jgi:hypothetical protein
MDVQHGGGQFLGQGELKLFRVGVCLEKLPRESLFQPAGSLAVDGVTELRAHCSSVTNSRVCRAGICAWSGGIHRSALVAQSSEPVQTIARRRC